MGKIVVGIGNLKAEEVASWENEGGRVPEAPDEGSVVLPAPSSSGLTDRDKVLDEIRIRLHSLEQCIATAKFALTGRNYDAAYDQFSTAEKHLACITADAQIAKG